MKKVRSTCGQPTPTPRVVPEAAPLQPDDLPHGREATAEIERPSRTRCPAWKAGALCDASLGDSPARHHVRTLCLDTLSGHPVQTDRRVVLPTQSPASGVELCVSTMRSTATAALLTRVQERCTRPSLAGGPEPRSTSVDGQHAGNTGPWRGVAAPCALAASNVSLRRRGDRKPRLFCPRVCWKRELCPRCFAAGCAGLTHPSPGPCVLVADS